VFFGERLRFAASEKAYQPAVQRGKNKPTLSQREQQTSWWAGGRGKFVDFVSPKV